MNTYTLRDKDKKAVWRGEILGGDMGLWRLAEANGYIIEENDPMAVRRRPMKVPEHSLSPTDEEIATFCSENWQLWTRLSPTEGMRVAIRAALAHFAPPAPEVASDEEIERIALAAAIRHSGETFHEFKTGPWLAICCDAIRAVLARFAAPRGEVARCRWAEDSDGTWETTCGKAFIVIEGRPDENDMAFCCYCGGRIEQADYTDAPPRGEEG